MSTIEELSTIEAASAGDMAAFERLYRLHSPRVYGLCLRLCRNVDEAQDCAQETFIQAWRRLDSFRGDSQLLTWLHKIALNIVLSRQRKAASEFKRISSMHDNSRVSNSLPDTIEDLEHAIKTLPPRARETFVLHKIYGYTHKQVGEMLGIAPGTCKAQVHRATKHLQQILSPDGSLNSADPRLGVDHNLASS